MLCCHVCRLFALLVSTFDRLSVWGSFPSCNTFYLAPFSVSAETPSLLCIVFLLGTTHYSCNDGIFVYRSFSEVILFLSLADKKDLLPRHRTSGNKHLSPRREPFQLSPFS